MAKQYYFLVNDLHTGAICTAVTDRAKNIVAAHLKGDKPDSSGECGDEGCNSLDFPWVLNKREAKMNHCAHRRVEE